MEVELLKNALSELGKVLEKVSLKEDHSETDIDNDRQIMALSSLVNDSVAANPWFIPDFVRYAIQAWSRSLKAESIASWLGMYPLRENYNKAPKKVGLVMAGNLPMVGLHDLLCILASGHHAVVKLSGQDDRLIPAITDILTTLYPNLKGQLTFTKGTLTGIDAIIATGSNNTSRYFEYYFGKYPHIIRRNRNGVAVIHGDEPGEWYDKLADDVFLYFGLGCRNVSKIYVPEWYDVAMLFHHFERYRHLSDHHKYFNNYEYQKSILLINQLQFLDNGFLLMRNLKEIPTAVSVIHFEDYADENRLKEELEMNREQIQCIVAEDQDYTGAVEAGKTQQPELWDYADGIDTMDFLVKL